jgi:hypothetical protein
MVKKYIVPGKWVGAKYCFCGKQAKIVKQARNDEERRAT